MIETSFTRLVGCSAPIQSAPMPGIATPTLVLAVAAAGAVGMLPATMLSPASLERELSELARQARGSFGVNFLMPFLDVDSVNVAAGKARIVEFFYGDPDPALVRKASAHGALVSWQVGSVEEARAAERAGCSFVVAQGIEAGGHIRGAQSILELLPAVLDAVRIPVVAAGGIGSARDLAAVLAFGAGAARLGTRLVAASESAAHPKYKDALVRAGADATCLTETFSVMWPNAPHRVLRSSVAAVERTKRDPLGEIRLGDSLIPVARRSVIAPTTDTTGEVEAMALYAGESVVDVHRIEPAAEIISALLRNAERLLRQSQ